MATKSLALKYGMVAVVLALAIIGTSLYTKTPPVSATTNFVVMLTDPPNVPRGTTHLTVTYSAIQLHVISSDGTANWVDADEEGEVDLLSLVEVTETIASFSITTGSTIDKIQFTISNCEATINGEVVSATILNEKLVVTIKAKKLDGTNTGTIIDLRPSLVRINARNEDGDIESYYVLVPSATAIVKSNVDANKMQIRSRHRLGDDDHDELDEEFENASENIKITASISVVGDVTTISVTLKNNGETDATITGLTLNGDFAFSPSIASNNPMMGRGGPMGPSEDEEDSDHPRTIPFKISKGHLYPIIGEYKHEDGVRSSKLELASGGSVTLEYSDVIQLHPYKNDDAHYVTITPKVGNVYTIRVMGMGSQTLDVPAS